MRTSSASLIQWTRPTASWVLSTAILVVLSLSVGCSSARVYNVPTTRLANATSLEKRAVQIDRAARLQGWTVETVEPGEMIATKRKGRHVAASTIRFSPESYSITLRNSVDLDQSGDRIHKLYNVWVEGLEDSIRRETNSGTSAVSSPPSGE